MYSMTNRPDTCSRYWPGNGPLQYGTGPVYQHTVLGQYRTGTVILYRFGIGCDRDILSVECMRQSVVHYTFKRKDQATTLLKARSSAICSVQIDPELLFQRLSIAPKSAEQKEEMFRFELCPHPPSLFDETLMLREAQKSVLGDAIWSIKT